MFVSELSKFTDTTPIFETGEVMVGNPDLAEEVSDIASAVEGSPMQLEFSAKDSARVLHVIADTRKTNTQQFLTDVCSHDQIDGKIQDL